MKAPAAKLKKLKELCGEREKLAAKLKGINEQIAVIRRELEGLLKLATPDGVTARARVIPCASSPKPSKRKRKPPPRVQ